MNSFTKRIALAGFLAAAALTARAQQYQIDWYKIAGGGGTSTGGVYTVSGTIGQPDTGAMSGGSYSLTGGFWSILGVVQTPNAPVLSLHRAGANVVLSWPVSTGTFKLESAAALSKTSTAWSLLTPTPTPVVVGGTNYVTNAVTAGTTYFRLAYP